MDNLECIILDVQKALKGGAYLSSLALALTIPDVCGKAKYPDLKTGCRYRKWLGEYFTL